MESDKGIRRLDGEEKRVAHPAIIALGSILWIVCAAFSPGPHGAGYPPSIRDAPAQKNNSAAITEITAAELAPQQPHNGFFGERSALVHRDGVTYLAYADWRYGVYMKSFDHRTGTLSAPAFIAAGGNDHINPSVLLDRDGYFHVFFGARPYPIRYLRSRNPLAWNDWHGVYIESVGQSATYPVPIIIGDKIFLVFREGGSYGASLSLAVRDMDVPVSIPGAWSVKTLVKKSSSFIPMPLAAFEMNGAACFLFNLRDALISFPLYPVSPSIREGLAVICTADGIIFTDIDGRPIRIPLDYTENRSTFPTVLDDVEYTAAHTLSGTEGTAGFDDLVYDGSFIEFEILVENYADAAIRFGGETGFYGTIHLTPGGQILMSSGPGFDTTGTYMPRGKRTIRLKMFPSLRFYRAWIDSALACEPMVFTNLDGEDTDPIVVNRVTLSSDQVVDVTIRTGREVKLITASACLDQHGESHIFYIDRRDSTAGSYWALMHRHGGYEHEIGNRAYNKYHPSSISMGGRLYVAAAYFEGDGAFQQNNHLCPSSRVVLLRSEDHLQWEETQISTGAGGHVHPIFKRITESGPLELIWANMMGDSVTHLVYGYASDTDTVLPDTPEPIAAVYNFPNPFNATTTIVIDMPHATMVSLAIFDANGMLVKRLLEREWMERSPFDIVWRGDDRENNAVASGVYFIRLTAPGIDCTRKLVLLR